MAKMDKKIHEYRMSGARWILDIVQRDGIEAAEEELKLRGAVFVPMEIPKNNLKELSDTLAENCYHTILSTVLGVLVDCCSANYMMLFPAFCFRPIWVSCYG